MTTTIKTNIYVVDDDASVRRSLARVVRSAGHNAVTFASAENFFASDYRTFEGGCLIVDGKMPRSSGLDMLTRLRSERVNMPVIVVSAHDDPETRKAALDAGANGYFRKPVDSDALLDAITWALKKGERKKDSSG